MIPNESNVWKTAAQIMSFAPIEMIVSARCGVTSSATKTAIIGSRKTTNAIAQAVM